ncbi:MAG: HTTM domain-containing protein [Thermomicrobiales bacterium]
MKKAQHRVRRRHVPDHAGDQPAATASPRGHDQARWDARWWERGRIAEVFGADLRSLALLRIVLAIIVLIDVGGRVSNLRVHYSDEGVLPRELVIDGINEWRWSLALANGSVEFQALIFGVTALAALAMLVGYRTRLMTIIVWALIISIQVRNPLVLSGADTLFRLLLFWSMFLPLGAVWSVDQKRRGVTSHLSMKYVSLVTVGLFLQISFMYWFTAALKTGAEWREDGTALYYALGAEQITKPFGEWIHQFPTLLQFLTFTSLGLEIVAPIVLFVPILTGPLRTAAILAIMSFHLGIFLTMDIGIFPWTSALCMVSFLPTWFWESALPHVRAALPERVSVVRRAWYAVVRPAQALLNPLWSWLSAWGSMGRLAITSMATSASAGQLRGGPSFAGSSPATPASTQSDGEPEVVRSWPITNLLATFFIVFIFGWNMTSVSDFRMPAESRPVAYGLGLYQKWNMFSPRPPRSTSWYVVRGALADGRQVDLLTPIVQDDLDRIQEYTWEQPDNIAGDLYKDKYWRKYLAAIARDANAAERREFAAFTCRSWNDHHTGGTELIALQISVMIERTLPDYGEAESQRDVISEYRCV